MPIKQNEEMFTIIFDDKTKKPISYSKLAEFIKTDRRKYAVVNAKGEPVYTKTFKG